jgi:hypothetical protein
MICRFINFIVSLFASFFIFCSDSLLISYTIPSRASFLICSALILHHPLPFIPFSFAFFIFFPPVILTSRSEWALNIYFNSRIGFYLFCVSHAIVDFTMIILVPHSSRAEWQNGVEFRSRKWQFGNCQPFVGSYNLYYYLNFPRAWTLLSARIFCSTHPFSNTAEFIMYDHCNFDSVLNNSDLCLLRSHGEFSLTFSNTALAFYIVHQTY